MAQNPRLDGWSWTLLLALALLWSASFVFVRLAGLEFPPLTLVLLRVGLGALVLNAFVVLTGRSYPTGRSILTGYAVMGILNNIIPFALIVYATGRLGAGSASILNATTPIFTLLIAHVATRDEKITASKATGILLGFLGVAAMTGPDALAGLGNLPAVAAMLAATFCYGVTAVYGRRFIGVDPIVSATCQTTASTLILLPIAFLVEDPFAIPTPSFVAIGSVVGVAVLSTALAYVIFYALISRAGGTNTTLVTLLIPVGGVFMGWLFLGEAFTAAEAVGMLLIGLGLMVIDGRTLARLRGRAGVGGA